MASERYYGTGRRKSSVARVYLSQGTGKIMINKRDIDDYFGMETLKMIVRQPFGVTNTSDKWDLNVFVHGGGYTGCKQCGNQFIRVRYRCYQCKERCCFGKR